MKKPCPQKVLKTKRSDYSTIKEQIFHLIHHYSSTQRAWQTLMTASEETTERIHKHMWAGEEVRGKTLHSCFLPSSLCSSSEGVPCDLPDLSLRLTEGTTALFFSPLTWFYVTPPTQHHSAARRKRWGGGATSRRDSPSGFLSVPGHCTLLAGILFTHTHTKIHAEADD